MTCSIRSHTTFPGPNIWSRSPVTWCVVDAAQVEHTLADLACITGQYAALAEHVHEGTSLEPFPFEELEDIGVILAHMALDLQRIAGVSVTFCFGRQRTIDDGYDVVVEHRHTEVGLHAIRLATRWLSHLLRDGETFDLIDEFARFATVNETNDLGVMGRALAAAAAERGIPAATIDPRGRIVEFGDGCFRRRLRGPITSLTPAISVEIARDKHLTNRYLRRAGLPVPENIAVRSLAEALVAARTIGYPVALKPIDQADSVGVALDLRSDDDIRARFEFVAHASRSPKAHLVVERFVPGNDYRVLVVNDTIAAASQRLHPQVIGDGSHTIRELIEIENANPRRGTRSSQIYKKIVVDEHVHDNLARMELSLDDVPPTGHRIVLKQSGSRRDGAIHIDMTEEIHPVNATLMRTAARVLGLDVAGIDLVTPDISQSILEVGGAIIEINEGSAFNLHLFPGAGPARDPGPAIMAMLFPPGTPVRVPVVAVTASDQSAAICHEIARAVTETGRCVGCSTRDGVTIGGTAYLNIDGSNPTGPRTILNNPNVEIAVVEVDAGSIASHGLGFGQCDVAVVTALSGLQTPLGEPVEIVLLRSLDTGGLALLNAAEPSLAALAAELLPPVVFFEPNLGNERLQRLLIDSVLGACFGERS